MRFAPPGRDCPLCPRLVGFRAQNRGAHENWHNAPVESFGGRQARLLIVGLAPGLRGANRTGRPFTGDGAGAILYPGLIDNGFAEGHYSAANDGALVLIDCRVTNALRCVPPHNKPVARELAHCRRFLAGEIADMARLRAVLALGRIAHDAVLSALALTRAHHPFAHGARHRPSCGLALFDSYHCSRYNINTGRLSEAMFRAVLAQLRAYLDKPV